MALIIQWSKKADKSFDKILAYLLLEWGESLSRSFTKKVFDFLDILSEFSELGTIENPEKGIRGFLIVKQIVVFYKITEKEIIILDFFDTRQHPEKKKY
jgi:plasmid stabilization system protein ParE